MSIYLLFLLLLLHHSVGDIFYNLNPKLQRPIGKSCSVELFSNVSCGIPNSRCASTFQVPLECSPPWAMVAVDFVGHVMGV